MAKFVEEQTIKRALRQTETLPDNYCPNTGKPTHKGSCLRTCLANHNLVSCCVFDNPEAYPHCPDYPKTLLDFK